MQNEIPPTIVVIIAYYNGSKWVEKAIKSVMNQTIKADEFIIVNDGSSPEEREALAVLATKYPFLIVDKENGGQGSARNAGVAASHSSYICFLDQDDFFLPNHNRDLLSIVPKDDPLLGFTYADIAASDEKGNITNSCLLKNTPGASPHPKKGSIKALLRYDMFILPTASLIFRPAFNAVGGFDEQFMGYEDDDLFFRLFRAGYTNYFLDKPVAVWCTNLESTSWSITMSRSRMRYFKKLMNTFKDDEDRGNFHFRDSLVPRFQGMFVFDLNRANKKNSIHKKELNAILHEYAAMVYANQYVGRKHKLKLALTVFSLQPGYLSKFTFYLLSQIRRRIIHRKNKPLEL